MKISDLIVEIKADIKNHDGFSITKLLYIFLFDARFRLLLNYRIGKFFYTSNISLLQKLSNYYKYKQITKRNCEISFNAKLGVVKFMHPIGIVIGNKAVLKDGVEIWQQVTIGSHGKPGQDLSYPTVQENVKIYAGAKIIGDVLIGRSAIIGANSVVNINIPANTLAVGCPAVVKKEINELLPD